MGIETDQWINVVAIEGGHDHIPGQFTVHAASCAFVDDFEQLRVFHHVHAVLIRAFRGDRAGVGDAIPVADHCAAPGSRQTLSGLAADVTQDRAHGQIPAGDQPHFAGRLGKLPDVVDKSHQHGDAHVAHQFDLRGRPRLLAGARGQEQAIGIVQRRFAHEVPTVDHAVTVNRMDHVAGPQALHAPDARHEQRLHLT